MSIDQFLICEFSKGEFSIAIHLPVYRTVGRLWWKREELIEDEFRIYSVDETDGFENIKDHYDSIEEAEEALSRMINGNNIAVDWKPKYYHYNKEEKRFIEQNT